MTSSPETTQRSGAPGEEVPCARCEQVHDPHPPSRRFIDRPVIDLDGTIWTHWWTCPETGDPVYSVGVDSALAERFTGTLIEPGPLHAIFRQWIEEGGDSPPEGIDAHAEACAVTVIRIAQEQELL